MSKKVQQYKDLVYKRENWAIPFGTKQFLCKRKNSLASYPFSFGSVLSGTARLRRKQTEPLQRFMCKCKAYMYHKRLISLEFLNYLIL